MRSLPISLAPEIYHYIMLFLLDRKCQLKASGKYWCHCCGEQVKPTELCSSQKCISCCKINCIDRQNVYRTNQHAPPLNDEQLFLVFNHYPTGY